jgi:hypothetical protein
MNKVHTLYRIVKTRLGSAYAHPMKTFDELKTAEDALTKAASGLAEVIEGTVLVKTPEGPRAVMTVKQLLIELGVEGFSYSILSHDVHGGLILTPGRIALQ